MNIPDLTGGARFMNTTGLDPIAQRELEEATARFLMAACKAWPRLAPQFLGGCVVSITTAQGVAVRLRAGGEPAAGDNGLILPGGRS